MQKRPFSNHHTPTQYVRAKNKQSWWKLFKNMNMSSQASLILSALLILVGAAGLFLVQGTILNQSQDIRQQASVDTGQVLIRYELSNGQRIVRPGTNNIDFFINTQSIPSRGITLVMELWPGTVDNPTDIKAITQSPEFKVANDSGLRITRQEIEQKGDGYLILSELVPTNAQSFFATTSSTKFGSLTFNYTTQSAEELGISDLPPISIVFDNQRSVVGRFLEGQTADQAEDILRSLAMGTFESPTGFSGQIAQRTQTMFVETSESTQTSTSTSGDSATAQATAIATSNTKPASVAACNEVCTSNHQCAAGYACYASRCRNPLNLGSTTCAAPDATTANSMIQQCNQACSSHRDCPANMLCHTQSNTCRLAANPGSVSCSPASDQTVSRSYETKGGIIDDTNQTATVSGSIEEVKSPIIDPDGVGSEMYGQEPTPESEATMNENQQMRVTGSFLDRYLPTLSMLGYEITPQILLVGMIGLGLTILGIIILFLFLSGINKKSSTTGQKIRSQDLASQERDAAAMQLQQKIANLQNKQTATPSSTQSSSPTPAAPVQAQAQAQVQAPAQPQQQPQTPQPAAQPFQPATAPKPVPASSNMMSRLRLKGIAKPGLQNNQPRSNVTVDSTANPTDTNNTNQENAGSQGASQDFQNS